MQRTSITINRRELLDILSTLSTVRRQRFKSVVPIWLEFQKGNGLLQIQEEKAGVAGSVRAAGSWPPTGATVDLHFLKRAMSTAGLSEVVELILTGEAILIPTKRGYLKLKLLPFGPTSDARIAKSSLFASHRNLPLFRWAGFR